MIGWALSLCVALCACRPVDALLDTTPDAALPVMVDAASGCRKDSDCQHHNICIFTKAGCATPGICVPDVAGAPAASCATAIPMCSCSSHRTFYGPGGCAGQRVREAWELYGCPCATDAECTDGQACAESKGRPGKPKECQNLARK